MKIKTTFIVANMEQLVQELDGPLNVWTFNKGSVENRQVENTHGAYFYKNEWGVIQAIVIDSSNGCGIRWEYKA